MYEWQNLQSTEDDDAPCMAKKCVFKKKKTYDECDIGWVQCDNCLDWFHVKCTSLPDSITEDELNEMNWLCAVCEGNDVSAYNHLSKKKN